MVDGPGFLSPLTAAIAASRRYQAELRRDHDLETKHAAAATAAEDEGSPEEAAPDGVGDGTTNRTWPLQSVSRQASSPKSTRAIAR